MTRKEAIEIINNTSFFAPSMSEVDEALNMAIESLSIDVVRCKDCRYWQEYQEGHYPNELCPWDKNETTDEDDYCSFGERKEG